jgi:hypothetical protein
MESSSTRHPTVSLVATAEAIENPIRDGIAFTRATFVLRKDAFHNPSPKVKNAAVIRADVGD